MPSQHTGERGGWGGEGGGLRPRGLGREAKKRGGAGARTFVRPAMRARSPGGAPPPPRPPGDPPPQGLLPVPRSPAPDLKKGVPGGDLS